MSEDETNPPSPPESSTLEFDGDTAALFDAFAKAQGAFQPPKRSKHVSVTTRDGRRYDFDYAPLEKILEATVPALSKHGLSVLQPVSRDADGRWVLNTVLAGHGGAIRSELRFRVPDKWNKTTGSFVRDEDPKSLGSMITYMKRYALSGLLGISADDDDDAGAASGDETVPREAPQTKRRGRTKSTSQTAEEKRDSDAAKAAPKESQKEPAPKAPAPKEGEPIQRETMQAIIDRFGALDIKGAKKGEICLEATGVALNVLDEESAQKLLSHLRGMR